MPLLLLLIMLFGHAISHETRQPHNCIHSHLTFKPQILKTPQEDKPKGRVLQSYQNIRIAIDSSQLSDVTSETKDYLLKSLLAPSKNLFESALKVVPYQGKIVIRNETICDSIPVPEIYKTSGVDADLLIFITHTYEPDENYLAYAGACAQDEVTFRPIIGLVNFNLAMIAPTQNAIEIDDDIRTTLHEITHVLGFSSTLYEYFINPQTNQPLTGHFSIKLVNGQIVSFINVEPLTSRLRAHFNCETLEGAYLENQGGYGNTGSHFERRVFYNEYMTASAIKDTRITEFTLDLLQGTGWYQVDYTIAEPFTFGKNRGCEFLDSPCMKNAGTKAAYPEFCDQRNEVGCSLTRRGISYCPYQTLYMDQFANSCPIKIVFGDADCENQDDQLSRLQYNGPGSKCFTGNLPEVEGYGVEGVYCLRSTCEGNSVLKVYIGSTTVTCTSAGDVTAGTFGTLTCPDPESLCNESNYCKGGCFGRGKCVQGQCQCFDGWTSTDCTQMKQSDNCTQCLGSKNKKHSCYGDTCDSPEISGSDEEEDEDDDKDQDPDQKENQAQNQDQYELYDDKPPIGIIIGAALGGIVVIAIGIFWSIKLIRKRTLARYSRTSNQSTQASA